MIKTTRLLQKIPVTLRVVEEYIQTNDFREDKTFILIHTPEFLLLRLFASSSASDAAGGHMLDVFTVALKDLATMRQLKKVM